MAQNDSTRFDLAAFADMYVSGMPRAKGAHTAMPYVYSYNRVNELALNMVLLQGTWHADQRTVLNIGLMTGTYASANLANEPALFRFLYEANIVYALSIPKRLSLQAGVFPSHIGMESAIGIQNQTLTRSLQADNSPYYESGVKLTHALRADKGELSVLLLNGWQQIARFDGQTRPAVGHQFLCKPHARWTFNSSSFLGMMGSDSLGKARYFHDAWLQYKANTHWSFSGGFDLGNQRRGGPQFGGNWWSTLQLLAQYKMNNNWSCSARWERANDVHQTVFTFTEKEARRVQGYSVNVDYSMSKWLMWRTEVRCLKEQLTRPYWFATTSLLCYFKKSYP